MSDVVIRAEGLGKRYVIGHQADYERRPTLRDVIAGAARGLARSTRDMMHGRQLIAGDETEEFWALRDVNFEIKRGDVVGVIGRNGAGKSTLLKILSRITEPTAGRVEIKGRVASLLEVGTGFHPELSGRENIYLNGAILGMSRAEIKRKFDEIVAFAEIEKFLDTPVKRYSSGMYVRLAFAVAAHLEPEILIVDEVLAVGDAEFQKKCLGKMGEVAGRGRTVIFVSHNLAALRRICDVGILLSDGRIAVNSTLAECIDSYNGALAGSDSRGRLRFPPTNSNDYHIVEIMILNDKFLPRNKLVTWEPAIFAIYFYAPRYTRNGAVTLQISTVEGLLITLCVSMPDHSFALNFDEGTNVIYLRLESIMLSAGKYVIGAGLAIANTQWLYNEPLGSIIEVSPKDVYNTGVFPSLARYPVPMRCRWLRPEANQGVGAEP